MIVFLASQELQGLNINKFNYSGLGLKLGDIDPVSGIISLIYKQYIVGKAKQKFVVAFFQSCGSSKRCYGYH